MRKREAITLICRLFSLYIFYAVLVTAPSIPGVAPKLPADLPRGFVFAYIVPLIFITIWGLLLWRKAGWIGTRFTVALRPSEGDARPTLEDYHAIALSVLGMFVLASAIMNMPTMLWSLVHGSRDRLFDISLQAFGYPPLVAQLASFSVRLTLGVGLVVCSGRLVVLGHRTRATGSLR